MSSSSKKKKNRSIEGLSAASERRAVAVEAVALSTESVQPLYSDPVPALTRLDDMDTHNETALVEAANEAQLGNEGRRVVQVNSKNKKIQFHKTKKLRKRASALYMKSMADMTAGKFQVSYDKTCVHMCFAYVNV
ncbi:hypothetical protein EON65_57515 [archaeon]|nr:MAG: hypothetical protein EON65_57515 [archaeon]